jgi:hypothetical protein
MRTSLCVGGYGYRHMSLMTIIVIWLIFGAITAAIAQN